MMKYFKELDSPAVDAFMEHPTCLNCKAAFLNHFTYISHDDGTKRLHPPFVNSYQSLAIDPCISPLKDNINGDYSSCLQVDMYIISNESISRLIFVTFTLDI
jgi:hypothetical protein